MIWSSLAYLRKKMASKKIRKKGRNNCPSWIDKREVHKNDVALNTEQRKEQEEVWERDGHKNGQDRLEKDIMPQSETQKLKHTHLLNFLWLGTLFLPFFTMVWMSDKLRNEQNHSS